MCNSLVSPSCLWVVLELIVSTCLSGALFMKRLKFSLYLCSLYLRSNLCAQRNNNHREASAIECIVCICEKKIVVRSKFQKFLWKKSWLGFLRCISLCRLNSYKCITDTLQELVNQSKAAPQSPSVPKKPGPPVLSSDPNMLSNEEAGHHVRHE